MNELILTAFYKVDPVKDVFYSNRDSWRTLFDYYNSINDHPLQMSCRPCYAKVYYFVKSEISKIEVKTNDRS